MYKEWETWLRYGAAAALGPDGVPYEKEDNIMDLRFMLTDKLETERGKATWDDMPPVAKARLVMHGAERQRALRRHRWNHEQPNSS